MDKHQARDWWRQTPAGQRARYIQAALAGGWIVVLVSVHNVLADIAATAVFFSYAGYCQRASRRWAAEGDLQDDDERRGERTGQ
jgi:hypothetical protein